MNDLGVGVIDRYDFSVTRTLRGRGAVILETEQGYKRLMAYNGAYGRLEYINEILEYIYAAGFRQVDVICRNKEGELLSIDDSGDKYVVTDWFAGNECDVKSLNNVKEGAAVLALLHNITGAGPDISGSGKEIVIPSTENLLTDYEKHNLELRRARGYIRSRRRKTQFEYNVLENLEENLACATYATEKLKESGYSRLEREAADRRAICHGNYNYHNIIFAKNKVAVVNFEKSGSGILIKDFYLFFRKVMEKHNWDIDIGNQLIESYDRVHPIPGDEYRVFVIMLMYPEKFWKLVNHYYNSSKSWMPDKNLEKLNTVCMQQRAKEEFVRQL